MEAISAVCGATATPRGRAHSSPASARRFLFCAASANVRTSQQRLAAFPISLPFPSDASKKLLHKPRVVLPRRVVASVERSYVMIKPDGVQRGLVGEIISRFEKKGFTLTGLKLFQCPEELAQEHYKDLKSKPFFPTLIDYITSGPVVCISLEGAGVVSSARKLIGATNPLNAEPGTIRGDLAIETGRNVIHGSDSPENGEREIALWFNEGEVIQWTPSLEPWLKE